MAEENSIAALAHTRGDAFSLIAINEARSGVQSIKCPLVDRWGRLILEAAGGSCTEGILHGALGTGGGTQGTKKGARCVLHCGRTVAGFLSIERRREEEKTNERERQSDVYKACTMNEKACGMPKGLFYGV